MNARLMLRLAAPSLVLSGLLLAVGAGTALYIHRLERDASNVVAQSVEAIQTAENLMIYATRLQRQLGRFLATNDRSHLAAIGDLERNIVDDLLRAEGLASDSRERVVVVQLSDGYRRFFAIYRTLPAAPDARLQQQVRILFDEHIDREVVGPALEFLAIKQAEIERNSRQTQAVADRVGSGFLLLGVCGAFAGLVAGYGIARSVGRSLVQLSVPIRDAAGKLNQVVGPIDVRAATDLPRLEEQLLGISARIGTVVERLQQSQKDALRAEQLAALGQFAAGLAHELRNPLTAIKMLVQSEIERGAGGRLEGRDLAVLYEQIQRQEAAIQTFLDFARPRELQARAFDVREAVTGALDLIRRRAETQGVEIDCRISEFEATIRGDSELIRQTALNLYLNALDAMPNGGRLIVEVASHGGVDRESNGAGEAASVVVRVGDTGPGLPADLKERIFEPFVSTKETGTGLGLSICRRIVEAHAGTIAALNRPDGGAEFVVTLPAAVADRMEQPGSSTAKIAT